MNLLKCPFSPLPSFRFLQGLKCICCAQKNGKNLLHLNREKFQCSSSDIYQQFCYSNSAVRRNSEMPFFFKCTGRRLIAEVTSDLVKTCKGSMYISLLYLIFNYRTYCFIAGIPCRRKKIKCFLIKND